MAPLLVAFVAVLGYSPAMPPPWEQSVREAGVIADVRIVTRPAKRGEVYTVEIEEVFKGGPLEGEIRVRTADPIRHGRTVANEKKAKRLMLWLKRPEDERAPFETRRFVNLDDTFDVQPPWFKEPPSEEKIRRVRRREREAIRFLARLQERDGDPDGAIELWAQGLRHPSDLIRRLMLERIRIGEVGDPSEEFVALVRRQRAHGFDAVLDSTLSIAADQDAVLRDDALRALRVLAQIGTRRESLDRIEAAALSDPAPERPVLELLVALQHPKAPELATAWLVERKDEEDLRTALRAIETLGEAKVVDVGPALPALFKLYESIRGRQLDGAIRSTLVSLHGNPTYRREDWRHWWRARR